MYKLTPAPEIHGRIAKLQERLRDAHLDAAFLVQNADLFYFTGSIQQGILIVPAEGEPVYFVRRVFERAVSESPLPNVRRIAGPREVTAYFAERKIAFPSIGFELDVLPVGTYQRFQQVFPGAEPGDVSPIVREIRATKSPHEAEALRENGRKLAALLSGARGKIRPGVTEVALQGLLQGEAIGGGHSTINRMRAFNQEPGLGCVISGPDAAVPSYADFPTAGQGLSPYIPAGQGERAIQGNEPVIIDLMWAQDGYLVDMARTYSVGPMPGKMEEAYGHAVAVLRAVEAGIRPGAVAGDLYAAGLAVAAATPYAANFMGPPGYNT
ncbi:MAG: peptidase, partial [Deltaproteobacteria bacterium]|nr:peptidase [Deltaproteobacteria bacterium]